MRLRRKRKISKILLFILLVSFGVFGCAGISDGLRGDIEMDSFRSNMLKTGVPIYKQDRSVTQEDKEKKTDINNIKGNRTDIKAEEAKGDAKEELLQKLMEEKKTSTSTIDKKTDMISDVKLIENIEKSEVLKDKQYTFFASNMSIRKALISVGAKYKIGINFTLPLKRADTSTSSSSSSSPSPMGPVGNLPPTGNKEVVYMTGASSGGGNEYDNITISGNFTSNTLHDLIDSICLSGDIYCVKGKDGYIISKYETITIPKHLFPSYTMGVLNTSGTSSQQSSGSGQQSQSTGGTSSGGSSSGQQSGGTSSQSSTSQPITSSVSNTSVSSIGMTIGHQESIDAVKETLKKFISSEGIIALNSSGLLMVEDRPSVIRKIKDLIANIGDSEREMRVNIQVINVGLSDKYSAGIQWDLVRMLSGQNLISVETGKTFLVPKSFSFGIKDKFGNSALLNVLQNFGKTHVVKNWDVTLKSGIPSTFDIVKNVPYYTSQLIARDGPTTRNDIITYNINYQSVGLKIRIFPNIDKDIKSLKGGISIELSDLIGFEESADKNNKAPITTSTSIVIPLDIPYNHSYIISGFKTHEMMDTREGLPFLSQIPVLGSLFGGQSKEYTNLEMLIVITTL